MDSEGATKQKSARNLANTDNRWINIQQSTFTNWCNERLKGTETRIDNLITDLDDGVRLIVLLEQLAKRPVPRYNKNPRGPFQKLENLESALDFIQRDEGIYLVNIGALDLTDHKRHLILGLVWHLILHYQIFGHRRRDTPTSPTPLTSPASLIALPPAGGKPAREPPGKSANKLLLNWLKATMPEDVPVRNITTDWNDGKKLSALVNIMKPGLCPDYNSLSPSDALPNTKKAMEQAKEEFGVPQVIDPEHLCMDKPDELSCMTYLSYFCSGEDSPGYNNLLEWVRSKIPEYNIENFTDDWRDGRALSALVNAVAEGSLPGHAQLDPKRPVDNVREAMKTANDNLDGLVDNVTPEEFAHKKTDALAMMGYIEWYRKAHVKKSEAVSAMGPATTKEQEVEEPKQEVEEPKQKVEEPKQEAEEPKQKVEEPKQAVEEPEVELYSPPMSPPQVELKLDWGDQMDGSQEQLDTDNGPELKENEEEEEEVWESPLVDLGLTNARVAKPAAFTVDCRRAGPGNLSTSIKSPSGNDVPVTTSGEGMHSAEYTPQEVGPHNIVILYSGHQVNGSPFTAIVRDPSKVVAKGDGLENGTVGEKAEFAVSAKGAGPGKPVVKVTGPQGELSCDVEELYDHNYKYSYVPQSGGPHPISVVFAEEDVPGSPFTAQVKEAIPVDARKVAADGPHFPQMHRGPVFTDLNVSRAGDGQLSSTCHSNKFGSVPVTVSPPNGGVQRASFDPPGKDLYQQSVLWSGEHVPGSPFPVDLNPPLASEVRVDGPHPCIEGLGPVRTNIDVREAGDGQLTVKTSGERLGPVPTKVDPSGEEGRFRAEFQASQPDTYLQEVKWSGRAVPGSPFRVPVDLGEAMCLQEEMQDVESSYLPDSMADLYDQDETNQYTHSEPPEAIPSYFVGEKLSITADKEGDEPAGPVVAGCRGDTAGEIPVNLVSNPDGSRTAIIDPRVPDLYSVQVTMSGEHVPGSPFKVRYLPPPTDPSKCRLYNLPPSERRLVAHDDIMYSVDASQAGAGDLSIQSEGPSGAKTSTNLQVVPKENQDFKILYTPTKAGLHKHYIYWGKEAIPQSPVEFEVDPRDIPVYPWAKSVALDYEFPGLKAKDVSGHVLYQPSGKKVKSSVDKNKTQPEKMVASFKPLEAGIYEVHLLHHKNHVRGSPFEVRVLEPPRPDSVRVSGLEDAKCYVGDSVPFRADCSGAGTGELQMKVEGPAGEQEPSQLDILDNKDGTYSATFVPATVGNHLLHVKWADQPVPGSPYTVQAVPVEEPKMDAGLTIVEVGQPVDIQLADKPEDDVLASAKGDKTGSAHVLVQREEEGNHRVIFEPLLPDDYTVTVMLNESHIDGSPFRVKALEKTTIFADGEEGVPTTVTEVEVNSSVNFVLRPGPVEGSPDVRVIGPSGPLDTSTVSTEEGRYITHFKPDEEGDYFCNAKHDQKHLKGSPFRVLAVDRMKSDPSKCFILPEDVETMSSPYQHSQQVDFRVSTLNAGPGTLNVTSRGPGKADVVITDNKDGIYSVRFNPSSPGRYKLDVTWDEVSIRGSPCSVVIMGERKSRVLTGLDLSNVPFRVGKPYKFKIHCDELGEGEFGVKVEPAVDASVTVRDLGNRTYHVTLVPKQQGEHKVCVLHGNQHILGSPFACQFQQVGDASKCRLLEDAEEQQHEMGEKVSFLVTTEGAGPGVLSASVENIQKKTSAPADVEQTGETTYRVTFDPGQEEEYMLSIKYDSAHIIGSPFRLSFSTPPDPSQCKAEGEGLVSTQENRESTFEVTTDGTNSDLRVEIEGGFEKVDPVVTPAGEGKYSVAYTPKFPGEYRIQVLWNDEPISGSPYTVKSYRPADPSSLQVNKASVKDGILGNSLAFVVNSDPGNDGELTIVAHGPNQILDGTVVDNKDGTFGANFDPPEPGKYMVHVRYNGQHIEGSPFKVKVAAPPMPDKVKAYGPGLEDGIVDREGNFVVETKEAGAGTLAVRVHGPKGAFKINMKRDPTSERTILVRYDPTSVGEYTVDITWSETHVPGSPFKVQVRRAEEEPAAEEGQQNGDTAES